jgi:hypothetical protein
MDEPLVPPGHYQVRVSQQYTRVNPLGGKPLEGWRTLTLTLPLGTPADEVTARASEAAYAAELTAAILDAQVAAGPVPSGGTPLPATPSDDLFVETPPAPAPPSRAAAPPAPVNADAAGARTANPLTDKQLKAIYAIGRNKAHLGEDELDARCQAQYGCRPADLSRTEASEFITALQETSPG